MAATNGSAPAATVEEGAVLGLGNPLLDMTANVTSEVLTKYKLEANNAILAEDAHLPLYAQLRDEYGASYTAGGATQNAVRVAQWMLGAPGATGFIGAVGTDDFADKMAASATADGVKVAYYTGGGQPTGTCAVLVTDGGAARSLVANLSAANTYKVDHVKDAKQWAMVLKARVFYIAGFFLTVSPETVQAIGAHAHETGKTLAMNLSAPFLLEVPPFLAAMKAALPYVDVYFGNEAEAGVLAKAMGWDTTDVQEIAIKLAQADKASPRPRTVVFTQGADPTIVAIGESSRLWSVERFGIIPCAPSELVDTNGAGDAFAGGFLSGMAAGVPIVECVARGNYAANVVIKRSGCTMPAKNEFKFRGTSCQY